MTLLALACSIVLASGTSSAGVPKTSKVKTVPIEIHTQPNGAFIVKQQPEQPLMRSHNTNVKIDDAATVSMLQSSDEDLAAPSTPVDDEKKAVIPPAGPPRSELYSSTVQYAYKLGGAAILTIALVVSSFRLPSRYLGYAVCVVYVALSVSIDLFIASNRQQDDGKTTGTYAFDPACCVILVELAKLIISSILLASRCCSGATDLSDFNLKEFLKREAGWLSLPGVLFAANNLLLFTAIGKNDMATFGVFRETLILWTSLFWRVFFKVELGTKRLIGVGIIFVGMVGNRIGATEWSWAVLWILVLTLTNATATVVNEFALKRTMGLDINIQNIVLYVVCVSCSILVLAARNPGKLLSLSAFFEGFALNTVMTITLQILAGLAVSRILKYADSVTKCVAATLRGPILVWLAPYLVHSSRDLFSFISSLVVSGGCLVYLLQGPIQAELQKSSAPNANPNPTPDTTPSTDDKQVGKPPASESQTCK